MPSSLPPIPSPAPEGTSSAASLSLGPLELAQRLANQRLDAASGADGGPLLVVDVRSRRHFAHAHLPLSHGIPAGLLVSGEWPEGDLLLVDGGNGEAERVREALHSAGYPRRILLLEGGFAAWQAAGLPVASSKPSRSWTRWLGLGGQAAPSLDDLQELLGKPDLQNLLGNTDFRELLAAEDPIPDLVGLRRA